MCARQVRRSSWLSPVAALLALLIALPVAPAQSKTAPELEGAARRAERERRETVEMDQRAQRQVSQFVSYVQQTGELVGQLEARAAVHLPRMSELLTNDDGKRIAQDDTAFLHFVRLQEEPIVTLEEVQARKKSIASLLDGLKQEMEQVGVGYVPDEQIRKDINEVFYWARERLARLTERDDWLTTVIERAPTDLDLNNARTLKATISWYHARNIALLDDARMEGEVQAQPESAQKMAEAARMAKLEKDNAEIARMLRESRAQNERMTIEHELRMKQLQNDNEQKVADLERQLAAVKAKRDTQHAETEVIAKKGEEDAAKVRLRHKCEDPDVTLKLACFMTPGYVQPDGSVTIEKELISLAKLRARGALQQTTQGLEALIIVATNPGDKLRPRWSFPANVPMLATSQVKNYEFARDAQKYLIELGDTLVEMKMLAP